MDDIVFENLVLHEGEEKILIYVKPILANVFYVFIKIALFKTKTTQARKYHSLYKLPIRSNFSLFHCIFIFVNFNSHYKSKQFVSFLKH